MIPDLFPTFGSTKIIVSPHAYTRKPIFPDKPRTKRRNRRTIGKFGSLTYKAPAAYETPAGLVVHPWIYAELKRTIRS